MTNLGGNPTSYFSTPAASLDPKLFQGRILQGWVRTDIRAILNTFLGKKYRHADLWTHPWLAGSGVSYQWQAHREPGDLDCLVGVDYPQFRKANPEYQGLSDSEISAMLNESFREELGKQTENWHGYELTFYVNPGATDIRAIKPYAAYDLKFDEWTVYPDPQQKAPSNPSWDSQALNDSKLAGQIQTRFTQALSDVKLSQSEATRRNAQSRLESAGQQGSALYDEIHLGRAVAFSKIGEGYADFHNFRWQAGKRSGAVHALRNIKNYIQTQHQKNVSSNYGVDLPDASTLIRRAATYRNN